MSWDPVQYYRFSCERGQAFSDLLSLCAPVHSGSVVDLGCGAGRGTAELHAAVDAGSTLGIDTSAEMLARAPADVGGLHFAVGDLAQPEHWSTVRQGEVDLLFANASLQWVPDHEALLARLRRVLGPRGQLAFQVPANHRHISHRLAREIASEQPFNAALADDPVPDRSEWVLAPERYAEILHDLGAMSQVVRLQVYGHELASTEEVLEWVAGTLLTPFRQRLDDEMYLRYLDRYRRELLDALGDRQPYFYPFPRILCWAMFP